MAIDTTPSQVATSALQALPFGSIIGGPLKACIEAQAMAAKTSWNFIQEVGLNIDPETGEKKTVNVSFQFIKDGRVAQLNVPLLTIVPIPYISIQTIDISFRANINASASNSKVENASSTADTGTTGSTSLNLGLFKVNADFHTNYSSKKDSTATQDSKYSVEYTMDIAVKAGQDSMPAGLAKVLELLGNSLDVCDPSGILDVNSLEFKGAPGDPAMLIATYKNRELARMDREQKGKERLDAMQKEITDRRQKLDTQNRQELEASQKHVRELEKKQAEAKAEAEKAKKKQLEEDKK